MVTRPRLSLEGGGLTISLDDYLDRSVLGGLTATEGLAGFGLPDVEVQWFEGAGDGATYRGSRQQPREIPLPLLISGPDRLAVRDRLSALATALATPPATLRFTEPDGTSWKTSVVRIKGGDFTWGKDTDGETFVKIPDLVLRAGDPFWTRESATVQIVKPGGAGRGLLQGAVSLSALRLASGQVIGDVTIENPGDAQAYPVTVVTGPGTSLYLTSPLGEVLTWSGVMTAGQRRVFDHKAGTVVDETGANRYAELGPAPRFWAVPPGTQTAHVSYEGTALDSSSVTLSWHPRRWLLF